MLKYNLNIQYFATKKGVSSTKNGRDSKSKFLGIKKNNGQFVKTGEIIFRQRGTKIHAGKNVSRGKDDTLFSKINGIVKFECSKFNRKIVSVYYNKNNKI